MNWAEAAAFLKCFSDALPTVRFFLRITYPCFVTRTEQKKLRIFCGARKEFINLVSGSFILWQDSPKEGKQ
jgi:hypothetical protein